MLSKKWLELLFIKQLPEFAKFQASVNSRNFSASPINNTINYYDALGISRNATQTDIKAAYYKLSMIYHPDKNKGCEEASRKFRDINAAYEVLGNFRLRKLYDKGMVHTTGSHYADAHTTEQYADTEEDDPQTKFYKSRMQRSKVPPASGRTPIYNFDEWSKAHYGASFERKKAAKTRHENLVVRNKAHTLGVQNEILLFGMLICLISLISLSFTDSNDSNKLKEKEKKES